MKRFVFSLVGLACLSCAIYGTFVALRSEPQPATGDVVKLGELTKDGYLIKNELIKNELCKLGDLGTIEHPCMSAEDGLGEALLGADLF